MKVLIADDHPIFRSGIKSILETMPDIDVVAEAQNGADAYQLISSHHPDIAIMDLEMPLLTGLDVCKKVMHEKHIPHFIILTMHKEKVYFDDAMASGVKGYLLKDNASAELRECIENLAKGNTYVSRQIENFLTDTDTKGLNNTDVQKIKELLSPTEKVILKLISEGETSPTIAALLFISANTVDNHRANITRKLALDGAKNSLLKFAIKYKETL